MQKDFENRKCAHREEKIPVRAIFGFVFLKSPLHEFSEGRCFGANSQGNRTVLQRRVV